MKKYVVSRARRILPAYFSVVIISALALSVLSSLEMREYFTDSGFWKYLVSNLCFMNFLEPSLPGVFQNFKVTAVNGSLWTMKVEWALYLSVPLVVWLIARLKCRPVKMFLTIYVVSVVWRIIFSNLYDSTGNEIYNILSRQFMGQLMFFYSGVIIYFYYDFFIRHALVIALSSIVILYMPQFFCTDIPYSRFLLEPIAMSSLVLVVSMSGRWGGWESRFNNISYNIYLVHFPVIQSAVCLGFVQKMGVPGCFTVCLVAIVVVSWLINFCIERRFKVK